ncbi:MAG: hypothetical protein PHN91_03345 [Patescibacteria group bacterium]|jgi:hypothetical protein|nr:hypothetical protein [Patescibacteria group bacterium]MDD4466806.1 hypothetical protein [Patescibacteria group bacterium]
MDPFDASPPWDQGSDGYDDYGDEADPAPRRPIPATGRPSHPYIAEHYNYLESLYSSDYRPYLAEKILISHLSPAAKRAFITTIQNFFSHTALLSHQKDAEIAEIDLDIALNLLTLSCSRVDINLPEYPHLIEMVRAHFNRFIGTRAQGPQRERILQNRSTYEQVSTITNDEEKRKSKRGLGIINRLIGGGEN